MATDPAVCCLIWRLDCLDFFVSFASFGQCCRCQYYELNPKPISRRTRLWYCREMRGFTRYLYEHSKHTYFYYTSVFLQRSCKWLTSRDFDASLPVSRISFAARPTFSRMLCSSPPVALHQCKLNKKILCNLAAKTTVSLRRVYVNCNN